MVLSMSEVYLNGRYMPLEEAKVPVMDRGFLFGDGVYEVVPIYGGHPFRLAQHLDRLDNSLGAIRMNNPLLREEWGLILERLTGAGHEDEETSVMRYLSTHPATEERIEALRRLPGSPGPEDAER